MAQEEPGRCHKAGKGWEWSLNPSLLASELSSPHSLPPLESGICIPGPAGLSHLPEKGQRLTRVAGSVLLPPKLAFSRIRDFQILTLAV